ncbi:MAG TPA: LD-carboxypeptidase [Candidatus Dojkabacteria bacterium]|nr:LD-carboxypeptidase [Candidatus Dojkabacteria bacterium]
MKNQFIKPSILKQGDCVGVISPSDQVKELDVKKGIEILNSWGLKIKLGKNVFKKNLDFQAGTLEERKRDFLAMAKDPEVKVIWVAGGGYSSFDILQFFEHEILPILKKQRKTIIGYSDTTSFQVLLFKNNVVSIQGPNVGSLSACNDLSRKKIKELIFTGYPEKSHHGTCEIKADIRVIRPSREIAKGKLISGNLETLIDTTSAGFDFFQSDTFPIILGVEELSLEKSDIRRYSEVIAMHPNASRIKGIILGRFIYSSKDDYPTWSKRNHTGDIFKKHVGDALEIPIVQTYRWGHFWAKEALKRLLKLQMKERQMFYPMPNGVNVEIHTHGEKGEVFVTEPVFA